MLSNQTTVKTLRFCLCTSLLLHEHIKLRMLCCPKSNALCFHKRLASVYSSHYKCSHMSTETLLTTGSRNIVRVMGHIKLSGSLIGLGERNTYKKSTPVVHRFETMKLHDCNVTSSQTERARVPSLRTIQRQLHESILNATKTPQSTRNTTARSTVTCRRGSRARILRGKLCGHRCGHSGRRTMHKDHGDSW